MAIGIPSLIGSTSDMGSSATKTIAVGTAIPAGESIVVFADLVLNTVSGLSVSDSKGNVYTASVSKIGPSDLTGIILSSHNIIALTTSDVITINFNTSFFYEKRVWAYSISGLAPAALDKSASNNAGGSPWSSGSTGALTQADEIAVTLAILGTIAANSPSAGWIELVDFQNSSGNRIVIQYQIVSAITALNGGGTYGDSVNWAAMIATYKGASDQRGKTKVGGAFVIKPAKTKVGGAFVTKPVKVKVGGVFV